MRQLLWKSDGHTSMLPHGSRDLGFPLACEVFLWCSSLNRSPPQVFDQYVKTRAEEERKEKKNKLMQAKEEFRKLMEEAKLGTRSAFGSGRSCR